MSKSRPKSQSKSRKRSLAKGKLEAKAPMEERNSAAKTLNEQNPFSHFCWELSLRLISVLWKPVRKLYSFGRSDKKKEPSLSLETPDAAPSSSALATPCGASVAAKHASEEQTEMGPGEEILSFETVNDKDPCHAPHSTGHSNEALSVGPEDIEAVISCTRCTVGGTGRVDRVGYQKKGEAEVYLVDRLLEPMIGVDETKSDSVYWKQKHDDLKNKREVFDKTVVLRQAFSDFEKTKEFVDMNKEIKEEVLKLLKRETGKNKNFKIVLRKTLYTKILRTMHFQKGHMTQKSSFWNSDWRKEHRFPTFSDDDPEFKWWKENFDREILEKRLKILRVAAKKWNSERDIFMVMELVTDLNSTLHPQTSEKDRVEMFRLATTICSLRSGGDLISQMKISSLRRILLNTLQGTGRFEGVVTEDWICMPLTLSGIRQRWAATFGNPLHHKLSASGF